jgi:hypothetical protein
MLEAGISSTRLIGRFWSIVPEEGDRRSIGPAPPGRMEELRPQARQAAAWSGQAAVQDTIENALRSAGLMK